MKNPTIPILLGAALLFAGTLVGTTATTTGSGTAYASPLWDAARGAYVTGDATSLTFWKVEDGKVLEAHTIMKKGEKLVEATYSNDMPAASKSRPAGSDDGKSCGSCGGSGSCG